MKLYVVSALLILLTCSVLAQSNDTLPEERFSFEASYIGDNVNNLSGGIKKGSSYLGMVSLKMGLNTFGGWKGGKFYINAVNTHGGTPSADLIGDFHTASNIEAGNHSYIQEFWFKQSVGPVEITAGLQDLNVELVASENGSYFMNSSFGIMSSISGNIPAPIFPLTTLGVSLKWQATENTTWLFSAFDGCPTDFEEENPYNLKWKFNSGDGVLGITEVQQNISFGELGGTFKLGAFSHYNHGLMPENDASQEYAKNNYGFYLIADQAIWQRNNSSKKLTMFLQLGVTPNTQNCNKYFAGGGLNFFGLLKKSGDDVAGIAFAHASLNGHTGNETAIELSYQLPLHKHLFIQPDIQYIINPAGTTEKLGNSLLASLRFGLSF